MSSLPGVCGVLVDFDLDLVDQKTFPGHSSYCNGNLYRHKYTIRN